jgi:regulatory Fis family protein
MASGEVEEHEMKPGSDIGTPIAILRFEPDELANTRRLRFHRGYDDLDYVNVARLNANVALVRHEGSPVPGTEIVLMSGLEPVANQLESILKELGLSDSDLTWKHPAFTHSALPLETADRTAEPPQKLQGTAQLGMEAGEKQMIREVLEKVRWNRSEAARLLKISFRAILYKIRPGLGHGPDRESRKK